MNGQAENYQKILFDQFQCWAQDSPELSVVDWRFEESSNSLIFVVKFQRFNIDFKLPVDAVGDSNLHQIYQSAIELLERKIAEAYYEHNSDLLFTHTFGQQRVLIQATPGCRFCSAMLPGKTFKNRSRAHAVPQSVGNKNLITKYECDDCNSIFGNGIENDFGNFILPARAALGVQGATGAPKLKGKDKDGHVFVNGGRTEIKISANSGAVMTDFDPAKKSEIPETICVTLTYPHFHPMAVLKAYYKMLLSVLPEGELEALGSNLFSWIRDADHSYLFPGMFTYLLESFHPSMHFGNGQMHVYRRKRNVSNVPYITFSITFGNFVHQIFVSHGQESGPHSAIVVPHLRCLPQSYTNAAEGRLFDLSTTKVSGITIERIDSLAFRMIAKSECSLG